MALILSLDVMVIRDSINFCPAGKKKMEINFFYFNRIIAFENMVLKI